MSMLNAGSRVSRLGDSMTGELGFEPSGGAAHKVGFVANQGILKLLSGLGSVDLSAALQAAITVNCESISGDGLFYRLADGEACVFRSTGFAFEMLYAPYATAGVVCAFTQTFQFGISGVMTIGTVPLSRLRRNEVAASSTGAVTLITALTYVIGGVNLGTVNVGDRILVNAVVYVTKGLTSGETLIEVDKDSGAAVISVYNGFSVLREDRFHAAQMGNAFSVSGIFVVNVAGDLSLRLRGSSGGSDGTVTSGYGQIRAIVLNDG